MKTPDRLITGVCAVLSLMVSMHTSFAGSATWKHNPQSGDWNTETNWRPATVPNGSADTAFFGLSKITRLSISADTEVNGMVFDSSAGLNPFTITATPGFTLIISGLGIMNNSGTTQKFVSAVDAAGNGGHIVFRNSATAGTSTMFVNNSSAAQFVGRGETAFYDSSSAANGTFINKGGTIFGSLGGQTSFHDHSTAGNGVFTNEGGMVFDSFGTATVFYNHSTAANGLFTNNGGAANFADGGLALFFNTSTAADGRFINNGATVHGGFGGATVFNDNSSAGNGIFINNGGAASGVAALGGGNTIFLAASNAANATFVNNAATARNAEAGVTEFETAFSSDNASPSAGNGTFINNGATVSGAVGGKTFFYESSTADAATLIANGGENGGGGGGILFEEQSTGGTSRVEVFGNGFLDISEHLAPHPPLARPSSVTVGSIEGDGNVFLGQNNLTVGSNNLSTIFSGVIEDRGATGSLTKIGTGTLHLTGVSTYTGDTRIQGGVLQVDGSIRSNTFIDPSGSNRAATLAGTGTIRGDVTNNGIVNPGFPGTLTVNSYTQTEFGKLLIDIAGPNTGQFSVLNDLGTAHLNGILDPVLLNGFTPTVGESFTFMNYESLLGAFSAIKNLNFDNEMEHWEVTYHPTFAVLTVKAGSVHVPDHASTLLLLTMGVFGLLMCRCQLLRKLA